MKATELLELQTSADTPDSEKSISKNETAYERVDETPFALIKDKNGWFIALGRYRASDIYATKKQAREDINKKSWDLILTTTSIMIEEITNLKNNK